jgi:hypothetical protein
MEAKELRIGNCILKNGSNYIVDTLFFVDVYDGTAMGFDLQPIPLTEEWLLKFGFKRRYNAPAMLINYGELQSVFTINIVKNEFYFTYGDLQVKYLHQLQNLYFALTNEELTIKE